MDPCGTPREISQSGLFTFLIETNCLREVRYDSNQPSSTLSTPYFFSFFSKMEWLQVSNAFFRSQKIAIECFCFV